MLASFTSLFQEVGGRFFLGAMPPAFLLVVGETVLGKLLVDPGAELGTFLPLLGSLLGLPVFWTAVVLTALGWLLANRLLVQIWEGYCWLPLKPLARRLQSVWRRLRHRPAPVPWQVRAEELAGDLLRLLQERSDASGAEEKDTFPLRLALARAWNGDGLEPPFVPTLPTALGRILQAMEAGPNARYRIDAIQAWSRMLLVVPAPLVDQYRLSKTWLDLALHLASALVLLAVSTALLLHPASAVGWGVVAVLLLAGYLFYRLSLPFAAGMRLAFEAAFDLYRGDLLKTWGLRQPLSLREEQALWWMLQQYQRWGSPYLFPEEYRLRQT
ncbi:MAG TPA: hypothetical protein VN783_04470 [Thermoanaerobaculia bacterium]|nr:hypothetical protein [Thermoanaerobaculia bacterium]